MMIFKKKDKKDRYKPEIQRSSFTDLLHASIFAGVVTSAFILLGGIYALAPGSIIFYVMLIIIAGILVFLFAPINIIPEKIAKKYGNKPKTIRIRGNQQQLNQIAPQSIEITPDTVKINKQYTRTLNINQYPPEIMDGWLAPVIASNENITISTHIYPGNADIVKANLDMEIGKIDAQIMGMSSTDPKAVPLNYLSSQLKNYRDMLIAGQTQPFNTEIYLTLKAKTKKELEENTKETMRWFKGRNIVLKTPYMKMDKAARSSLPGGVNYLNQYHSFDTHSLKTFFPFTRNVFGTEKGPIYGYTVDSNPVIFSRFKMRTPHMAVGGATRSGKSFMLKYTFWRSYLYHPDMRVFIVDPTPLPEIDVSEYTPLTKKLGGQVIKIGEESSVINPFDIRTVSTKSLTPLTDKLRKTLGFFTTIFPDITQHEIAVLESVLPKTYEDKGITDETDISLFMGESPVFSDVEKTLRDFKKSQEASIQDRNIADKIARMIHPWTKTVFNRQTNIKLDSRWIVFDISSVRGTPSFMPVAFMVMDFIYSQCVQSAKPKMLLFDECHLILDNKIIREELAVFAREMGKYNAALTVASQSAEDFLRYPEGRTILGNCPVTILMRHEAVGNEMQKYWRFTPAEQNLIKRAATGSGGFSEGLIIAENSRSKILFMADPHEYPFITTKPEELIELSKEVAV